MELITQSRWPQLLKDKHIIVVVFYDEDQAESKKMLKQLESEFDPALKNFPDAIAVKVSIPDNPDLVKRLNVNIPPTLIMFHHGEEVKQLVKILEPGQNQRDRILKSYKYMTDDLVALVKNLQRLSKK
ncbi:MAG: hypothetical protein RBG13Loki_2957 [Promethearchaeota archaeon CR_4]|nr:MAG: hypothetical protein RBG13Loki_2957 [Candidatus Lokiarchaeota archaeon CR_4]